MKTPEKQPTAGGEPLEPPESSTSAASKPQEIVISPHDRLVNRTLQHLDSARSLLRSQLPSELLENLNLETLARADTSYIDPNLRRKFFDRLFTIEVSEEAQKLLKLKTKHVYALILVDHKSKEDSLTVIQLLGYMIRIWENAIENKQPLLPIIPWVIYNGVSPWRAAKSLQDLIPVPESWKRFVPSFEFPILDIGRLFDSPDQLAKMSGEEPILQVALTLLRYGREAALEEFLRPMLRMLSHKMPVPEVESWLQSIRTYIMSVNQTVGETKINELYTEFWPVTPEPGSVADQLLKKGREEGREEGREKGREEGLEEGLDKGREEGVCIGEIRSYQKFLRLPLSSEMELKAMPLMELQSLLSGLTGEYDKKQPS